MAATPISVCSITPHLMVSSSHFKKPPGSVSASFLKKSRIRCRSLRRYWIGRAKCSQSVVQSNSESTGEGLEEQDRPRPPFDLNLAVVLAGFAFEAYTSPPEDVGWRETDAADCQTVFLSDQFLREVYDGQLIVKLRKGINLPAMDPWGTSDPYVVLQLDGQTAKSKIKWAMKEPTWNEDFRFNIKKSRENLLQDLALSNFKSQ